MKKIIISNESVMSAEGKRTSKNCKPVYCIDDGKVYASVMDAADEIGVHFTTLSCACLGKTKTCKGKRYCFVSDMSERYEEIAQHTREMHADYVAAEAKRLEEARKEEERKQEEARLAREQKHREQVRKNYAQRCEKFNKAKEDYVRAKEEMVALGIVSL